MKQTIASRLRPCVYAALAAGAMTSVSQAADVIVGWDFEKVEADGVSIKSAAGNYVGLINDGAVLTAAGEGRPGGGKGFDVSQANKGYLLLEAEGDDNPMNKAAAEDQVTVVLWQKNFSNINSSSFWAVSGAGGGRGFQFHIPWSNGTIYFDTQGCCASPGQRLNQAPASDFDFTTWHHYAFVKNGAAKAIYVDGVLLAEQTEGVDPLSVDYTALYIGAASDKNSPDAIIDDFAIYKGALSETDIQKLAAGGSPFAPPVDTDGDGMPDVWETQYGFNPNDPSDAAKDFDGDGVSNLDEYKAGTNPIDTTKPVLNSSATTTSSFNTIILTFSEPVETASAEKIANYTITPSLNVTAATAKKNIVTLTTAAQTPGGIAYTVTVNNVLDTSKNAVLPNSTAKFYSYITGKAGVLKFSYWGGIPSAGTPAVTELTDDVRYPASPDWLGAVFSMNSRDIFPDDSHEAFGATIEGYLTPTDTADYDFFISSDDASEFWISTDDKEANLVKQIEETSCCNPFIETGLGDPKTTAAPIHLVANTKYFVRIIYKEGGGGDYAQVAWRKSTDTTPAASLLPISGKYLTSATDVPSPSEGTLYSQTPAPAAKGVSPATHIRVVHHDGKTAWTSSNVTLKVDGNTVTPTFTKDDNNTVTIDYAPPALLPSQSTHAVSLSYLDAGGQPAALEWSFTTSVYAGPTKDKVAGYPGLITPNAKFTADKGGHSGAAGDYAMDLTAKGGFVEVPDVNWAKPTFATDQLTVAFWMKKYDIADTSVFVFRSPSVSNQRAYHAHVPWSDGHIYFDTAGCCVADTMRLQDDIANFTGYTGDVSFWTNSWHHFAFSKKADNKQIWIDGVLFLEGSGANPVPTDLSGLFIGSDGPGGSAPTHAILDDFAVFSTQLVEADLKALAAGSSPSTLPAAKGLIALWDFNDVGGATVPTISIQGSTITYTGTLQSAATLGAAFAPVAGATSPYTVPADPAGGVIFYRAQ